MARGKDLKPRKKDLYSNAVKKRAASLEYRIKLSNQIKIGRLTEKDLDVDIEPYSFDETLTELDKVFPWTQGTNRKIFKDKKLYASILVYSRDLVPSGKKISERIYYIIKDKPNNTCASCNKRLQFVSFNRGYSKCGDGKCETRKGENIYDRKLNEFGGDEKKYRKWLKGRLKPNSTTWFMLKYPRDYEKRQREYKDKMGKVAIANLIKSKYMRASRIANSLFSILHERGYSGRCSEFGGEVCINIPSYEILNKHCIFLDFVLDKKVIEYDSAYFHDEKADSRRDDYLSTLGYKVYRVNHSIFKQSRYKNSVVEECVEFLNEA